MFFRVDISNFFDPDVKMAWMLTMWDLVSQVFLYWLGTVGIITITILVLMGISMSYDSLSWTWRREGEVAGEAKAAEVEETEVEEAEMEEAEVEEVEEVEEAEVGAARGERKGAKWKKSSRRAAERREREARSGRATPPFPQLLAHARAAPHAPADQDDLDTIYTAALSASTKLLEDNSSDAEGNEGQSASIGGVGGSTAEDGSGAEAFTSQGNSSSSVAESDALSGSEAQAPAGAEVAPTAPGAPERRGVTDLPDNATPQGVTDSSDVSNPSEMKAAEDAGPSRPENMQVALMPDTKNGCFTVRNPSFAVASHGDVRRLFCPYSPIVDGEYWGNSDVLGVSNTHLFMTSFLPNVRYFTTNVMRNKSLVRTCLATMDTLKRTVSEQPLDFIARKKSKPKNLMLPVSTGTIREKVETEKKSTLANKAGDKVKQVDSLSLRKSEESSVEQLKKELQAWSCAPATDNSTASPTAVLSTLIEISETDSFSDTKLSGVAAKIAYASKVSKTSDPTGVKAITVISAKQNIRPKSATANPSKPNTPPRSTTINPAKTNSLHKPLPTFSRKPTNAMTSPKNGAKIQATPPTGTAATVPKIPSPRVTNARTPLVRSTAMNLQAPKAVVPKTFPIKPPSPRSSMGRGRR